MKAKKVTTRTSSKNCNKGKVTVLHPDKIGSRLPRLPGGEQLPKKRISLTVMTIITIMVTLLLSSALYARDYRYQGRTTSKERGKCWFHYSEKNQLLYFSYRDDYKIPRACMEPIKGKKIKGDWLILHGGSNFSICKLAIKFDDFDRPVLAKFADLDLVSFGWDMTCEDLYEVTNY